MNSWKKYLPEYEFTLWNDLNFDVNICSYAKEAYDAGKYAFVSDYIRLWALYNYGGIYMDTDIEVLKPLDRLLNCQAFTIIGKYHHHLRTNFMGSVKGHPWIKAVMDSYSDRHFLLENGKYDMTPNICVGDIAQKMYHFKTNGQQQELEDGVVLYPWEVSGAYDFETGLVNITDNSYVIHWNSASWWEEGQYEQYINEQKFRRIFGVKTGNRIICIKHAFDVLRNKGLKVFISKVFQRIHKIFTKHRHRQ